MISSRIVPLEMNLGLIIMTQKTKGNPWEYHHPGSPSVKKFKTVPPAKKVMLTIFWDTRGMLYTEFLTKGSTVNSERYCANLRSLKATHLQNQAGKKHVSFAS
jgi:hypothetical protein